MTKPRFLAITGPTASGKTRLSLEVAAVLDGEVISMDSRQVYREMDIGTAKVTSAERARAPHHGLDLMNPDESYSAGRFAEDARGWIEEIEGRGRVPLLTGGTGFFLKALMEPLFEEPPLEPDRVERLRKYLARCSVESLKAGVRALDPERAVLAAKGGRQRLTRTLEIALLSGRPLSWWHRNAVPKDGVAGLVVCLRLSRDELDRRIEARFARMIEAGWVDEVRGLVEAGYGPDDPGLSGTGYAEIVSHLRGDLTLEQAGERIVTRTRQYARRQVTWFRHQLPEEALAIDAEATLSQQVRRVVEAWRERIGHDPDALGGSRTTRERVGMTRRGAG